MKRMSHLSIVILLCCTFAACQRVNRDKELQVFDLQSLEANKAFLANDFKGAEEHYTRALSTAEKMRWVDGIVMSKRNISTIYLANKKSNEAESILLDAKETCVLDRACSGFQLESVYNNLISLYIFHQKEPSKALEMTEEVIAKADRLAENKSIREILNSYVTDLRVAGFKKEAETLETRINSLKCTLAKTMTSSSKIVPG